MCLLEIGKVVDFGWSLPERGCPREPARSDCRGHHGAGSDYAFEMFGESVGGGSIQEEALCQTPGRDGRFIVSWAGAVGDL